MSSLPSQEPPNFTCDICYLCFTRKDNMIRHMRKIHSDIYNNSIHNNITQYNSNITQNTSNITHNSSNTTHNNSNTQNNSNNDINNNNNTSHKCIKCTKQFSRQWCLIRHSEKCQGIKDPYSCEYCHKMFTHDNSRFKHYKICKTKKEIDSKSLVPVTDTPPNVSQQVASTINNIQNQQNNNNTQNIVNILTFPQSGNNNFDFVCDQITKATMKALLNASSTPFVGFNKFIGTVLENPQNRIVHKTNPNSTYSKIHVGDGKWEFAHDDDVFHVITHHMTTAALGKVNEIKEDMKLVRELYLKLEPFKNHVTSVNEMDYDSAEYKTILQRIKLILVNLTRKWMEEEKMS